MVQLLAGIIIPVLATQTAAQTDNTCPDGSQPDVNDERHIQEGSASDDAQASQVESE